MAKHGYGKRSGGGGPASVGGHGIGTGGSKFMDCIRTTSPNASDASTRLKGPSVKEGATREGTLNYETQNPRLGPRAA
jgi:hypothetical protein